MIRHIQEEEDTFKTLVHSLCPAIYGHEMVKAGLLLGLFGGRQKYANDVNRLRTTLGLSTVALLA